MIPSMLAALAQFKRGGPTFFAGKATDGFRQLFDLYCSPGGINCLGEQTSHAAPNALTPPFHDFGYVRWPRAALREGARTVCPTMDASDAPALVFVHPFASLVLALERTPPEPEEEEEEQEEEEAGGRSTLFARRFGDLWGGNWIFPPYVALRDAGHRVHLSSHVVPGQINVLMAYGGGYLGAPDELANMCAAAVIACADTAAAPALLAAGCHVIVQNALQPTATGTLPAGAAARAHTLPMFPQQRLRARRAARGLAITRAVFIGDRHQLHPALATESFGERLRALGVSFDVVDKSRVAEWGDYRDADLVVALRPPGSRAELKPPSKLINAWLARVPALLGPEPAYQRLRRDEHCYCEVSSADEVVAAIARLREDTARYSAMLARCEERAVEHSSTAIAAQWADVLLHRVARGAATRREVG
jgi:hypothetical protein